MATKPNVMIVMDYSGSMQFRAYYNEMWSGHYYTSGVGYGYDSDDREGTKVNAVYDPTRTYYGIFQSNVYYIYDSTNKYWVPATTQPVTAYGFTSPSQDGGPVPSWSSGQAYAVNALVSVGGKSYMCTTAHTSTSTNEPGTGSNWQTYWTLAGSGAELIQFTANGHNLQVGQLVEFQGLTSHTGMNGNAYYVTAVSGNTFTVAYPWNGNPDSATGSVQRRIPGTLLTTYAGTAQTAGLSGNILNYASASRIDAALQALIGGPGTCDSNYCYIRGQGERSYLQESTNVQAEFYVRPASTDSSSTYPDDYSSGSYTDKTTYLSLSGRYTGNVTTADPAFGSVCTHQTCSSQHCTDYPCLHYTCDKQTCGRNSWKCDSRGWGCNESQCEKGYCGTRSCTDWECTRQHCDTYDYTNCDQWQCDAYTCDEWSGTNYYEAWTFTTGSSATHIDLTLTGTWTGNSTRSYLGLFNTTNFSGNALASDTGSRPTYSNPSSVATMSYNLAANTTYYVVVAANSEGQTGTYTLASSQELTGYDPRASSTFSGQRLLPPGATVPIGSIPQAQAKIRVDVNARAGIVQQTFSQVRYGFMYFNSSSGNVGKILVGCDNTDVNFLLNKFTTIYPYNGTPTGEALLAAKDYFAQSTANSSHYDSNSSFISSGSSKDPYWQTTVSGDATAVPCRKSYVVLISDGEWNGLSTTNYVDPAKPARDMHATDLRSDLTGTQSVDVYSIFAFGTSSEAGQNAMKAIAMFGGFTDQTSCETSGWPYNFSDYPGSCEYSMSNPPIPCTGSLCMKWPRSYCDPTLPLPSGHSYNTCCKEWDANWDKDTRGDNLDKGIPDNYFECSQGQDLQAALLKVLSSAMVKNATASAVATVAQQTQEGDIIIRGLFHASDPDTPGKYLWRGHLEAYWPYLDQSTMTWHYDFETNPCFEITDPNKNCWDGAAILQSRDTNTRTIYSWDPTTKTTLTIPEVLRDTGSPFPPSNPPWDSSLTATWASKLGVSGSLTAPDLIDWVRGDENIVDSTFTFRDRENWRLGDIIYSTPVVVGTPNVGAVSTHDPNRDEFYAYRNQGTGCPCTSGTATTAGSCSDCVYYRDKVVYVGANDGMIHAFLMARWDSTRQKWLTEPGSDPTKGHNGDPTRGQCPEIGKELWAYAPSNLLTELQYLAPDTYGTATASGCVHRTMVDLAPQSWEVYIKSPNCPTGSPGGRCWRTVILGGERGGGDVYFAIDVTDPNNPVVLWEYSMLKNRIIYDRSGTRSISNCANIAANDANCKAASLSTAYPFLTDPTIYEKLKILPCAWSRPAVGRLKIPTGLTLYTGDPATTGTAPTSVTSFDFDGNQARHVAFIGGGIRIFQDDTTINKDPSVTVTTEQLSSAQRFDLFRPDFLAIDIETGTNLFRYYWPLIQNQTAFLNMNATRFYTLFPVIEFGSNYIPYSMADPLALDVLNNSNLSVGDDGYVDTVYVGDLLGNFYGIKFNFADRVQDHTTGNPVTNSTFGMRVDWWQTKSTWEGNPATNSNMDYYRGLLQPITVPPVASFDSDTSNGYFLHVIFGAGKFEDVPDSQNDDMADISRTSIYNLKDLVTPPSSNFFSSNAPSLGNFNVEINPRCPQLPYGSCPHTIRDWPKSSDSPCVWVKDDGTKDCGENTCPEPVNPSNACTDPCWNCIFDLTSPTDMTKAGERVVRKALILGGLVFVTATTPPSTQCESQGTSMLYVLNYDCGIIPPGLVVFLDSWVQAIGLKTGTINQYDPRGWKVDLGSGVASNPVPDSSGTHVIVQMSTGQILNFNVNLPQKVLQPVGWRER